jgi:rhodanese-related sulfurtransferase
MNQPTTVPSIDVKDVARETADAAPGAPLIVDVREPDEFASERIDGVALLPISEFASRHGELPRDRPLRMICRSGSRSAAATSYLLQSGWQDVRNVTGGMLAWQAAGLPVRTGAPDADEGAIPG